MRLNTHGLFFESRLQRINQNQIVKGFVVEIDEESAQIPFKGFNKMRIISKTSIVAGNRNCGPSNKRSLA